MKELVEKINAEIALFQANANLQEADEGLQKSLC